MYCATCNKLITSESTSLLGHNYHSECLYCTRCKSKLWHKAFIKKKDGKLFCENLCSDEPFVLPPINGNSNNNNNNNNISLADLRKAYKRKKSPPDSLRLSLDEAVASNNINNTNIYNNETQKFLSNVEILRRRDQLNKNTNESDLLIQNRKAKNKSEPFDYNRINNNNQIQNGIQSNKTNKNKLDEPFNYNFEKKSPVKDFDQQRLANTSPFALFGKFPQDVNNHNTNTDTVMLCDKCNQFIDDNKEKCSFNNQTFHKKCFRCQKCFNELFRMKKVFNGPNGKEHLCEPCYLKDFGPKCPKCNEPIASYMLTTSFENKLYHKECFVCQRCKKYVPSEKYFKTGKMILCRNCL